LPHATRFGKRYYQRRTSNQGMYASAGYYTRSRMSHQGHYYPYGKSRIIEIAIVFSGSYGYPPVGENPPEQINGSERNIE